MHAAHRRNGFTSWELLIALAIAGLLTAAAVPGFESSRRAARMSTAVNQMVGALHFARSAAILRSVPTVVCLSDDGVDCTSRAGAPARGWIVFHDVERGAPVRRGEADELLRGFELPDGVDVRGTRAAVTFWPTARAGTTSTFSFCHLSGAAGSRKVIVSQTGRPRTDSATEGGGPCAR